MTGPQLENEAGTSFFRPDSPPQIPLPATTTDGVMRPGATPDRLRVLVLTKIFPNPRQPFAAAFNRQQFAALARRVDLQVVVPVQWFPGAAIFLTVYAYALIGDSVRDAIDPKQRKRD